MPKYGHKFLFLRPLLSFLAGISATWQHWSPELSAPPLFNAGWAGTASNPACCPPCRLLSLPCRTGPAGRYSQFSGAPPHTTSVARLPGRNSGQKAQKGPQKKKFLTEFWLILPKTGRKGAAENFQKKFLIFSCDNHV